MSIQEISNELQAISADLQIVKELAIACLSNLNDL